jgi:hypothetical protein
VELSETGVAFTALTTTPPGRDEIGNVGSFPESFDITDKGAEAIEKAARSARNASVSLHFGAFEFGAFLVLTVGEVETTADFCPAAETWDVVLPLLEPASTPAELPRTVAFQAARLARFGRVKGAKDAPIDIRFEPTSLERLPRSCASAPHSAESFRACAAKRQPATSAKARTPVSGREACT